MRPRSLCEKVAWRARLTKDPEPLSLPSDSLDLALILRFTVWGLEVSGYGSMGAKVCS